MQPTHKYRHHGDLEPRTMWRTLHVAALGDPDEPADSIFITVTLGGNELRLSLTAAEATLLLDHLTRAVATTVPADDADPVAVTF